MPVAWALQGPPGAPRPPLPPSGSRRADRRELDGGRGGRNPLGGAASCAALEDSNGRRYTGGRPPVLPVRPRLYRRSRNAHWSTAGLSAVLPPPLALAVLYRQGHNEALSPKGTMELDLASLPTLTVVQLRGLCTERGLPATNDLRKHVLIKSLTARAEAQEVDPEEAPEEGEVGEDASSNHSGEGWHLSQSEDEEDRSSLHTVTSGRPKASWGKGVPSGGENLSLRERELEAQLAFIALEAQKLALEEKKWANKEKRDGGSNREAEVSMGGFFCPRLPKGVVPAYVEGDDIDTWLEAFERALQMRRVKPQYWGSLLWELVPNSGRDMLLTLREEEADSYPSMKRCLTKRFGLIPEQYRMKFGDTQKVSTQSWVDFVDTSLKALEGWIIGNKVNTYEGLYNLIMREHILNNCTQERLRQNLVDSKLTNPRELGEAADEWLRTRVVVKSQV
ncbi:hypothetical protein NDU88_002716 [Pleurodeles waltl]|uniref:SAP domain-containing protein n=1 Tax=Pleurodeles waltl TaxID=8319 RepID=A0AAV7UAK2_PLEWA|nr:hypothetical protein NDU88_002716 [Pleurodeles waltl]